MRLELAEFVTPHAVEETYRRALAFKSLPERERSRLQDQAARAMRARDPKLLAVLDRGIEILHATVERQMGQTMKTADVATLRVPPTEYSFWKAAYETLDKGEPLPHLMPIYVAAGQLAGVVV